MNKLIQRDPLYVNLQWFGDEGNPGGEGESSKAGSETSGQGAGESNEFLDDLPESLKTSKQLARFRDKQTLAQSYVELEGKLGKMVQIPGKDDSPEAWDKYFSRVGRPKTAEEYTLSPFVGYKSDPVFDAAFKIQAYKDGLSAKAAQSMYATVTQRLAQDEDARKADAIRRREGAVKTLKETLGDSYTTALAGAQKSYAAMFSPESQAVLREAGLEDDPRIIGDLAKLSKLFGNDRLMEGSSPLREKPGPYSYMNEGKKRPG